MKKRLTVISLVLLLCLAFGCRPGAGKMTEVERSGISGQVKELSLDCAEAFGTLELEPYMKYYLDSDSFTFVMNGQTTRSYSSFYDKVKSSMADLQEAEVEFTDIFTDVYGREFAIAHGPFKWTAVYRDGRPEEAVGHMSFVYVLHNGEWKIAFATEYFPYELQAP